MKTVSMELKEYESDLKTQFRKGYNLAAKEFTSLVGIDYERFAKELCDSYECDDSCKTNFLIKLYPEFFETFERLHIDKEKNDSCEPI